ncbi:TPA: hypothetical protein U8209_001603 [Pseudomonas putida]|nr:hypothetical protein [Pseudomonas putida]
MSDAVVKQFDSIEACYPAYLVAGTDSATLLGARDSNTFDLVMENRAST